MKLTNEIRNLRRETEEAFKTLEKRVETVQAELDLLEGQEVIEAKPHWQAGMYLYLEFPGRDGAKRRRDYVGSDPDKIRKALEGIKRWNRQKHLRKELEFLEARLHDGRHVCNGFFLRVSKGA